MKLATSILATLAFVATGAANAGIVIAQDNFDSATSGTGWDGGWSLIAPTTKTPAPAKISNASLVFVGNADKAAVRELAVARNADVLVNFTLEYSGVLGTNDFVGLWFGKSTGPNIGLKANCGDTKAGATCTNDLFVRTTGTDGYFLQGSNLEAGKSYEVFGHLYKTTEKNNDYYDRFDAWFKPAGTALMSATVTAKGNSGLTSFDTLGFRSANIDGNLTVSIDNLNVANVPEPGSLALMGLALAGFAAARRRQRG